MTDAFTTATKEEAGAQCPDGGVCHHVCSDGPCFRVRFCGPLSGVFPGNRWPDDVRDAQEENR